MKPKISTPAVETPPPVVSDIVESNSERSYQQRDALKKGLLSTILSSRRSSSDNAYSGYSSYNGGNKVLG